MRIALLGMSGVGKSHWSQQLAKRGWRCFPCDEMIAARLRQRLGRPLATVHDLGRWMGFPYEAGYREREGLYLGCEAEVVGEILDYLRRGDTPDKLAVDLTGSAIYLAEALLNELREYVTMVYLAVTPAVHQKMLHAYCARPRPIIWGDLYPATTSAPDGATLEQSYTRLIAYREGLYEKFCDVKLEYHTHRSSEFTPDDFLECVAQIRGAGEIGAASAKLSSRA